MWTVWLQIEIPQSILDVSVGEVSNFFQVMCASNCENFVWICIKAVEIFPYGNTICIIQLGIHLLLYGDIHCD